MCIYHTHTYEYGIAHRIKGKAEKFCLGKHRSHASLGMQVADTSEK